MFRKILRYVMCSLVLLVCLGMNDEVRAATTFANGADVSWVPAMEANGYVWYDQYGVKKDVLSILKDDFGVNAVRLRVFVNPSGDIGNGWCDKANTIAMAKRAKALGLDVMIDFHYSDTWADPANQKIPAAWSSYSFEQLMNTVYNYTYDVMSSLASENIYPKWVQVGNETNNGMLWDYGKATNNMKNFAWLINCGYDAVKAVSPNSKVIVHLANGNDNALYTWMFDGLVNNGAKFDVIGMSLYPSTSNWSTLTAQTLTNMNSMISRYNKEIMICEVGMDYASPDIVQTFLADMVSKVKSLSNSKGLGVFYWEPAAYPGFNGGYNLGACDSNGKFTSALKGFGTSTIPTYSGYYKLLNRSSNKCLDSLGSTTNGTDVGQWESGSSYNQQWQLVHVESGYYKILCRNGNIALDSLGRSSDGNNVGLWQEGTSYNQQWKIVDQGNGYVKFINRVSGKCLDTGGLSNNGDSVQMWYDNASYNQQWKLVS